MGWALLAFIGVSLVLGVVVAILVAALRGKQDTIDSLKK